jgi:hypothetical protein
LFAAVLPRRLHAMSTCWYDIIAATISQFRLSEPA